MPQYVKGDVVWVPFPFSDEDNYKLRPAIVLASWPYKRSTDYHLCMVSTQLDTDSFLIDFQTSDLQDGKVSQKCYIRPTYNFSVDENFIQRQIGRLKSQKLTEVITTLIGVLQKN